MRESKISRLILSMTDAERSKLDFWIRDSQSRSEALKMTYQALRRRLAKSKPFTKTEMVQELFPDLTPALGRDRLSNYLTRLLKEVVHFIAMEEMNANEFYESFCLLRYYNRRGLDQYYPTKLKKLRKLLDEQADAPEKLHHQLQLEIEHSSYMVTRRKKEKQSFFEPAIQALDHFWLTSILELTSAAREYDLLYGTQHTDRKQEIWDMVHRYGRENLPEIIQVQLQLYERQESTEHAEAPFEELLQAIKSSQVADDQTQHFYELTINILTRLINLGHLGMQQILVRLYRDAFQPDSGFTPRQGHFKNRISLLSRLRMFQEAEEVLQILSREFGENDPYSLFCRAQIEFDQGAFAKAIQISNTISTADANTLLGLDVAVLQWKAAVMGGKKDSHLFDLISSKYDSLRMRILRAKRISAEHRENYLNFKRLFQCFFTLQSNPPENLREELEELEAEVKETYRIANKQWLLDTIQRAIDDL